MMLNKPSEKTMRFQACWYSRRRFIPFLQRLLASDLIAALA